MCWPASTKYSPYISSSPPGPSYSAVSTIRTRSPPRLAWNERTRASRPIRNPTCGRRAPRRRPRAAGRRARAGRRRRRGPRRGRGVAAPSRCARTRPLPWSRRRPGPRRGPHTWSSTDAPDSVHDQRPVHPGVGGDVHQHGSPAVLDGERSRAVDRRDPHRARSPRPWSARTRSHRPVRRTVHAEVAGRAARRRAAPRSRLSGVNRQISSRPVGTGWSARSNDAAGWRWLATVSTALDRSAAGSVPVASGEASGLSRRRLPSASRSAGSARGRTPSAARARSAR